MNEAAIAKRFEVVRCLGEGGMGVVYEVRQRDNGARVALKTLRHMTPASLAGLKREFRAMQDVHHDNLVSLGELVSEPDGCFFTMELVDGGDILEYVRARPAIAARLEELATYPSPVEVAAAQMADGPEEDGTVRPHHFDEGRLRSALRQLGEALRALHAAGLVHRDVKSSNVRVGRNGRVVLLDFGLVADRGTDSAWTQQNAGTPAYMAPEQVILAKVGPEADWYAFGVLLFEALTGKLPFEGHPLDVMRRKQKEEARAASALNPDVPGDLDELCAELLRHDPAARPQGSEVLRRLGSSVAAAAGATSAPGGGFVGRRSELAALGAAFDESRRGQAVTVVVEGESGVGKTALVRSFAKTLAGPGPSALVLVGRCYERESVPYKGLDGVVDALARALANADDEADAVIPLRVAPLVQVFPVLRRVAAIADRARGAHANVLQVALRQSAFEALREMLARVAQRRPLVLVIDDAQWCDADSLDLLAELLRPPDAPPLLLVMTVRNAAKSADARQAPWESALKGDVRRISLGPLPTEDATVLASQLLARGGVGVGHPLAHWSVRQSGGHPLFMDMILSRADRYSGAASTKLALDDVLWAIVEELEAGPRAILERAVVAGAPVRTDVLRQAAGLSADAFAKGLSLLRVAHLVQASGSRADRVEPYHDRVRAAVLAHLTRDALAESHRRLAVALETSGDADPEALVMHWQGAGEPEWAAQNATIAGDRASHTLAFDRAAGFYELALTANDMAAPERRALLVKLARSLECAGRGEQAARAYLDAANGAPVAERVELERVASVELLSAGKIDDGAAILYRVLAAAGYRAPRKPLAVLFWLVVYRLLLRVRGLAFEERSAEEVRRSDRARIDALFAGAMGLAMLDTIFGVCLSSRHLIAALRRGDRFQVLRATIFEATVLGSSTRAPGRQERALVAIASRLAEKEENAQAKVFYRANFGAILYMRGRWREALALFDEALAKSADHNHDIGWVSHARVFGCWSLNYLGEYAELARRRARWLVDAQRRGDLYTSVQLRDGSVAAVGLAADDPSDARREAREAIAQWPHANYLLQHWHASLGEAEISLYEGDGAGAYGRLEQDAARLERSLLLKVPHIRGVNAFVRGRSAIATANAAPSVRGERLAEAAAIARALLRERMAWTTAFSRLLQASAADARNDPAAADLLRSAIEHADAADMTGHANAARHRLGELLGGDDGGELVARATAAMTAQGIRAPARFAAMLVPGRWGQRSNRA